MEDFQVVLSQKEETIQELSRKVRYLEDELTRYMGGDSCSAQTQGKKLAYVAS